MPAQFDQRGLLDLAYACRTNAQHLANFLQIELFDEIKLQHLGFAFRQGGNGSRNGGAAAILFEAIMRIDIVERADFSMFSLGTSAPTAGAGELVQTVAHAIEDMPNALTVRGHTDALGFTRRRETLGGTSNWSLSTARADATRRLLMGAGIPGDRFRRIEGVADTDPYVKAKPNDPRNRRISVTLLYQDPA